MTARELLREVANWMERAHGKPDIEASLLRALANRIDEEMDRAVECNFITEGALLARLDADLTPPSWER